MTRVGKNTDSAQQKSARRSGRAMRRGMTPSAALTNSYLSWSMKPPIWCGICLASALRHPHPHPHPTPLLEEEEQVRKHGEPGTVRANPVFVLSVTHKGLREISKREIFAIDPSLKERISSEKNDETWKLSSNTQPCFFFLLYHWSLTVLCLSAQPFIEYSRLSFLLYVALSFPFSSVSVDSVLSFLCLEYSFDGELINQSPPHLIEKLIDYLCCVLSCCVCLSCGISTCVMCCCLVLFHLLFVFSGRTLVRLRRWSEFFLRRKLCSTRLVSVQEGEMHCICAPAARPERDQTYTQTNLVTSKERKANRIGYLTKQLKCAQHRSR